MSNNPKSILDQFGISYLLNNLGNAATNAANNSGAEGVLDKYGVFVATKEQADMDAFHKAYVEYLKNKKK